MHYQWSSCSLTGPMLPGFEDREIPERLADRAAPPEDVFVYPLVDSWRARVWHMIGDVATEAVREEFVADPPEYIVSDDLSWLDDLILRVTGRITEMKTLMADRLSTQYRAFRAGHATRTDDLGRFYREGLRLLRADHVEARARALWLNGEFPHATETKFQAAIDDINARDRAGGREGWLYFSADERSLITQLGRSGHYLVYGSEYLYCLGIRLVGRWDTKRGLKAVGRPTMFICDIPMTMLRDSTIREFGGLILELLFSELIDGMEARALSPGAGSALSLDCDLPGEHVVGHYHPAKIYDPL